MDCHRARELIEQRLREGVRGESDSEHDWSDLEVHLISCSQCSTEWSELRRTGKLLEQVASDRPTAEEVETMWNAVLSAAPGGAVVARTSGRISQTWRLVITVGSIAAVLGLAFRLGHMRYGGPFSLIQSMYSGEGGAEQPREQPELAYADDADVRSSLRTLRYTGWDSLGGDVVVGDVVVGGESSSGRPHTGKRRRGGLARVEKRPVGDSGWGITVPPNQSRSNAAPDLHIPADSPMLSELDSNAEGMTQEMFATGRTAEQSGNEQLAVATGMAPTNVDSYSDIVWTPGDDIDSVTLREFNEELGIEQPVDDAESDAARSQTTAATQATFQPTARTQTRIIKTGVLAVEVDSYEEAADQVQSIVQEHGAFVADTSTQERTGGALAGQFVIRVAPDRFETLFASLKGIGRVEAENVKSADVTADYVDLEARIATLRITEQRLAELITNKSFVDKMSALLEVEREMTRIRTQIEHFTGRLRVMADQVALSTITLSLHEPARTVPSASLAVEVPVLDVAAKALGDALGQVEGRLISGNTSKQDGGALKGTYQLRVSLAKFGELVTAVEGLGRVEQRQINDRQFGEAAAAWASDVQCHLSLMLFERSRALPGGSVSVEVGSLTGALSQLDSALVSSGGSIVSNRTTKRDDGSSTAVLTLRVPAGGFSTLVDSLGGLGRTTDKTVWGEAGAIIGGAAAAPCDLTLTLAEQPGEVPRGHIVLEVPVFEVARERLSELVVEKEIQVLSSSSNQRTDGKWVGNFRLGIKAGRIEAVLTSLGSLGRVASRHITGIGLGDLSRCAPDTLSVIDLTLGEKEAMTPPPERAGGTLRNHLRDGLAGLYASLGLIAYGLIVMAPWLVIVFLLAWVVMRIQRRHQAANGG